MMYEDYKNAFYERLTKLRIKKQVSAREMSLAMGQSHGYITQLESKHRLPSMTVFFYICDYLNITPKDYFDDEIEYPTVLCDLLDNLKQLDEEQLINVNNIVRGLLRK
jgi:transcriptional regulator with XRE-family HTH domain